MFYFKILRLILVFIIFVLIGCYSGGSGGESSAEDSNILYLNVDENGVLSYTGAGKFEGLKIEINDSRLKGQTIIVEKLKVPYDTDYINFVGSKYYIYPAEMDKGTLYKMSLTLQADYNFDNLNIFLDSNGNYKLFAKEDNTSSVTAKPVYLPGVYVLGQKKSLLDVNMRYLKFLTVIDDMVNFSRGISDVLIGENVIISADDSNYLDKISSIAWSLTEKPGNSSVTIENVDEKTIKIIPDVEGEYTVTAFFTLYSGKNVSETLKIYAGKYELTEYCNFCHDGKLSPTSFKNQFGIDILRDIYNPWKGSLHFNDNTTCGSCHGTVKNSHSGLNITPYASLGNNVCKTCHLVDGIIPDKYFSYSDKHEKSASLLNAGNDYCYKCHSGEGFLNTLIGNNKGISEMEEISGITCNVCHDPHNESNYEFQLRDAGNIVVANTEIEAGKSKICYRCHGVGDINTPSLIDAPHNSQREMLEGIGAFEYGKQIKSSIHKWNSEKCVFCHMNSADGVEHNFSMRYNIKKRVQMCNEKCHSLIGKSLDPNLENPYDFLGHQTEIKNLLGKLKQSINMILNRSENTEPTMNFSGISVDEDMLESLKKATYNYLFVKNDRSYGVHNFNYAKGVLEASLEDLSKYINTGN